jgi:FkbM family methyltransferase
MIFYNENGELVDITKIETNEQDMVARYIEPQDCVLELGARYGTVSCIINQKLADKTKQVSVEPLLLVHQALEENMARNNCQFTVWKGFVSKKPFVLEGIGYGATFKEGSDEKYPCISLEDLEAMYGLQFDTLVADCEGGLEIFFDDHPWFYSRLKTAIIERDLPYKCNYDKIEEQLTAHGLQVIDSRDNGFYKVWKKMA